MQDVPRLFTVTDRFVNFLAPSFKATDKNQSKVIITWIALPNQPYNVKIRKRCGYLEPSHIEEEEEECEHWKREFHNTAVGDVLFAQEARKEIGVNDKSHYL